MDSMASHCVNVYHVHVEELNNAVADVLIALGRRIRVLSFEEETVPSIAWWREVCSACTNLEAVHFTLRSPEQVVDVLSLIHTIPETACRE